MVREEVVNERIARVVRLRREVAALDQQRIRDMESGDIEGAQQTAQFLSRRKEWLFSEEIALVDLLVDNYTEVER